MSRGALIASLGLHVGLLSLVGVRSLSTVASIGPGDPGADVSFWADGASGFLSPSEQTEVPHEDPLETSLKETAMEQPTEPETATLKPIALANPVIPSAPPISVLAVSPYSLPIPATEPRDSAPVTGKSPTAKSKKDARGQRDAGTGDAGAKLGRGGGIGGGGGGPGYVLPRFLLRYKPLYPEEAREQQLEGTVLILVTVDTSGRVTEASLSKSCGHAVLDKAAIRAVRYWRFLPAQQDGVAIAAKVEVPVRFRFEESAASRS